jgi:5-methyltetrahydrofolate--homocysteine methyltransferase
MVGMPCQTILVDGAMGTRLQQLTSNYEKRSPFWNMENPELVREIHRRYLQAGAQILLTNTFGAQQEPEFHSALECVQGLPGSYRIAGSIGPTTSLEGLRILAPKVDIFVLETFSDLRTAREAFSQASQFHKPVVASFAWIFENGFRLYSGETFETVIREVRKWSPAAIGANCNLGTMRMVQIGKMLAESEGWDVWIKSNAGQPRKQGDSFVYDQQPEEFASELESLLGVVQYLGGCCGTDERHLRNLFQRKESWKARSIS